VNNSEGDDIDEDDVVDLDNTDNKDHDALDTEDNDVECVGVCFKYFLNLKFYSKLGGLAHYSMPVFYLKLLSSLPFPCNMTIL